MTDRGSDDEMTYITGKRRIRYNAPTNQSVQIADEDIVAFVLNEKDEACLIRYKRNDKGAKLLYNAGK